MHGLRALAVAFTFVATGIFAGPAGATTFTFDLTGDPASLVDIARPSGDPFTEKLLFLTDADTGSNLLPGISISQGDIVNVNITLNTPLGVPQRTDVFFQLQTIPDQQVEPTFTPSILFSNGGVPVGPPAGSADFNSATVDLLSLGYYGLTSFDPVSAFSFAAATLSATIGAIATRDGEPVSSATLIPSTTAMVLFYPTPVPRPAAFWLRLLLRGGASVQTGASYIG